MILTELGAGETISSTANRAFGPWNLPSSRIWFSLLYQVMECLLRRAVHEIWVRILYLPKDRGPNQMFTWCPFSHWEAHLSHPLIIPSPTSSYFSQELFSLVHQIPSVSHTHINTDMEPIHTWLIFNIQNTTVGELNVTLGLTVCNFGPQGQGREEKSYQV